MQQPDSKRRCNTTIAEPATAIPSAAETTGGGTRAQKRRRDTAAETVESGDFQVCKCAVCAVPIAIPSPPALHAPKISEQKLQPSSGHTRRPANVVQAPPPLIYCEQCREIVCGECVSEQCQCCMRQILCVLCNPSSNEGVQPPYACAEGSLANFCVQCLSGCDVTDKTYGWHIDSGGGSGGDGGGSTLQVNASGQCVDDSLFYAGNDEGGDDDETQFAAGNEGQYRDDDEGDVGDDDEGAVEEYYDD